VRLRDLTHRLQRDPLLKVGAVAMILALMFAVVVVVAASLDRPMEPAIAKSEVKSATVPLVRSDPGVDPWVERDIPPPKPEVVPGPSSPPEPTPDPQPVSTPKPDKQPESRGAPTQTLPLDEDGYPLPTNQQLQDTNHQRHYDLPPGAIMSLTIKSMGLKNAPVLNSEKTGALDKGVVHLPDTSFPWSDTPERNVYLAGHRLGWPGTGSHLVFYHLNQLDGGEKVTLRDRRGNRYDYRVIDRFTVGPKDSWVTGRVESRDLLTLQTCTPIPTFHRRLIVRAERI